MGSSSSKGKEICGIKAVEEMTDELSQKEKMFRNAILKLADKIKEAKNQMKDEFIYTIPKVDLCNRSLK